MKPTYIFNISESKVNRRKLRNNMTLAEITLWRHLKNRSMEGLIFRRQFGLGPYIVDFYCPSLRLAIELDGDSHIGREAYDQRRQKYIERHGIRFLRFLNTEVHEGPDGALETIRRETRRLRSKLFF